MQTSELDEAAYETTRTDIHKLLLKIPLGNPDRETLERALQLMVNLHNRTMINPVSRFPNATARDTDLLRAIDGREKRGNGNRNMYLVKMDIDSYGQFNKCYGQQVGDAVLRMTLCILKATIRKEDNIYHPHGEEIDIHLKTEDHYSAMIAVNRCRRQLALTSRYLLPSLIKKINPAVAAPKGTGITISSGVAFWDNNSDSYKEADREADANLHIAKAAGKNRICCRARYRDGGVEKKMIFVYPDPVLSLQYIFARFRNMHFIRGKDISDMIESMYKPVELDIQDILGYAISDAI